MQSFFFSTQQLEHEMYTRNDFSTERVCFPLYKKVNMKVGLFFPQFSMFYAFIFLFYTNSYL